MAFFVMVLFVSWKGEWNTTFSVHIGSYWPNFKFGVQNGVCCNGMLLLARNIILYIFEKIKFFCPYDVTHPHIPVQISGALNKFLIIVIFCSLHQVCA